MVPRSTTARRMWHFWTWDLATGKRGLDVNQQMSSITRYLLIYSRVRQGLFDNESLAVKSVKVSTFPVRVKQDSSAKTRLDGYLKG